MRVSAVSIDVKPAAEPAVVTLLSRLVLALYVPALNEVAADNRDRQERFTRIDVKIFVLLIKEELTLEVTIREGNDVICCASTTKLGDRRVG